mmetsp:Transcript_92353/g.197885  ORF Transcript_92353/g.197885 Transcript_92353/m.197885 type:complete len:213 (-) Transcript_92353:580-1218(-)
MELNIAAPILVHLAPDLVQLHDLFLCAVASLPGGLVGNGAGHSLHGVAAEDQEAETLTSLPHPELHLRRRVRCGQAAEATATKGGSVPRSDRAPGNARLLRPVSVQALRGQDRAGLLQPPTPKIQAPRMVLGVTSLLRWHPGEEIVVVALLGRLAPLALAVHALHLFKELGKGTVVGRCLLLMGPSLAGISADEAAEELRGLRGGIGPDLIA